LFGFVDQLKDGEMLCNPEKLDLEETMSAFEFGCSKMDIRKDRNNCLTPQKANADNLMPLAQELSEEQKVAMINETFV
jgi:hypothetical protein